jgi:hypothetical protein
MSDLKSATEGFFAKVDRHTPDQSKRVREVLNDLVRWSDEQGLCVSNQKPKGPISYCLEGVAAPFWTFAPHTGVGAKLTLLADRQFPEELREEARQVLAKLDGRTPEEDEVPSVGYLKLLWPPNRDALYALMARVANRIHGGEAKAVASAE